MTEDWIEDEYNKWKTKPCYVPYIIDELMEWRAKSFALHILKKYSQKTSNKNSQQIKKDDDLIGKSSGDTKQSRGSNNDLKDWDADNQSADNPKDCSGQANVASKEDTNNCVLPSDLKSKKGWGRSYRD